MNQFRTMRFSAIEAVFWCVVMLYSEGFISGPEANGVKNEANSTQELVRPILEQGAAMYAAIDTTSQTVYLFQQKKLWSYQLGKKVWKLEAEFNSMPVPQMQLEFGLNQENGELLFWSYGVGEVYRLDVENQEIIRIDRSYHHKNQFGHIPFFRDGDIHAFGGYGLWVFKNYITKFNAEIGEWTLITVDRNSPLPEPRYAYTGFYNASEDEFYIFGGNYSVENRPDDKNIERRQKQDIWKFKFKSQQWDKLADLSLGEWEFDHPGERINIGKINLLSSSVYSPVSKNYYIPVHRYKELNGVFYFGVFNTETHQYFEPAEIQFENDQAFIISNNLFNPKTEEFVFIGIYHLSNQREYPVQIVTLSEEKLLGNLQKQKTTIDRVVIWLSFGGVLIIVFVLFYRTGFSNKNPLQSKDSNTKENIANILGGLSEYERKLIDVLHRESDFMESHELEEKTWPDIPNYDYRRKLRNETIKSVNEKFRDEIVKGDAIIRKKDPNDNRRFLYNLNEMLRKELNQLHTS